MHIFELIELHTYIIVIGPNNGNNGTFQNFPFLLIETYNLWWWYFVIKVFHIASNSWFHLLYIC